MQIRTWLASIFLAFFTVTSFAANKAVLLNIDGAIGPAVQDYITRGISKAATDGAKVVIIQINTPGGLETSMRGINEAIISSPIPVLGFVAPSGARAASAGTFIIYATNFAAMAPGTNIGAASPVRLTPEEKTDDKKMDAHEKKAVNDASAYIRSLAQLRGRNAQWAETAVTKAASISAEEALKLKVIDAVVKDAPALLAKADGKKTKLNGENATIASKDLVIEEAKPDWRNKFLAFITDPNIAYLLMLAAMYGLFFEISNPGLILPGVIGVIALLLMLYAFQLMPINYVGLALIVIGISFMIAEVYMPTFGVVGIGGIIAFVIGSIMLYDSNDPHFQVTRTLILLMSTITAAFIFLVLWLVIRAHQRKVVTGEEAMLGAQGIVISAESDQILVNVMGEVWTVKSDNKLSPGQRVTVVEAKGLTLKVQPIEKE